ncbi:MAG: hypothetical protein KDE04_01475 [Anaerolineales bacterium]|nr:hypothetical protein [Anaerolineales bacterium]MCB0031441.1 hypothetical protein [Anaerolineales bacterium]MCB8958905.1 hypothetical protein [Ardenticatenales bacterium]
MASNPRPKFSVSAVKRPTFDTSYHIDYEWWDQSDIDLKTYLVSRLPQEHEIDLDAEMDEVDIVDMQTGEVRRVDGFEYVLQTYFNQLPDDFLTRTPLAEAIFYILLANANQPLTVREIAERVGRAPDVVLKTVSGPRVYKGIRPVYEE